MEGHDANPPMPQPQPTGGPPPVNDTTVVDAPELSSEPPPYDAQDPHPEYKAAYGNESYPSNPSQFPVQINQPAPTPYPTYSANYYPTNVTSYNNGANTVVIQNRTGFSDLPVTTQCGNCRQVVTSRVEYVTGSFTWMMCCLICLFCPFFCWLIPFCMVGMKDSHHYCPACNHLLGVHSRL